MKIRETGIKGILPSEEKASNQFDEKAAMDKLSEHVEAPSNPGGLSADELARRNRFKNMFKEMNKPG